MTQAREPDTIQQSRRYANNVHIDRFYTLAAATNQRFDRLEAKLTEEIDTILRHLSGLS
jgi:protein-disulfide isomerase-like protein with CxxC motif